LAININDDDDFFNSLEKVIDEYTFGKILSQYPDNQTVRDTKNLFKKELLPEMLNQKDGGWKFPEQFHLTCLFMGGKIEKTQNSIWEKFPSNPKDEKIEIKAILFSPGNIITAVCSTPRQVEN
jgi:hypothetical protein